MMNESGLDRALRVVLGVVLLIVGFAVMGGTAGVIVGIIGFIPLVTGAVGMCPIYRLLGIRTNEAPADSTS